MDPSDLDITNSSPVQIAIGTEAAILLVETLIKKLQLLRFDVPQNNNDPCRIFSDEGKVILRYCRNLLVRYLLIHIYIVYF